MMKKSEVNQDLKKIIERLNTIKNSKHVDAHKETLLEVVQKLQGIKEQTSSCMVQSITRRQPAHTTTEKCRFCGKP
jgi:hypothetical protein